MVKLEIFDIDKNEVIYERELPIDDLYHFDEDSGKFCKIKNFTIAANDAGSLGENDEQIDFIMGMTMKQVDYFSKHYGQEVTDRIAELEAQKEYLEAKLELITYVSENCFNCDSKLKSICPKCEPNKRIQELEAKIEQYEKASDIEPFEKAEKGGFDPIKESEEE